jgi:FkbM family methyltransferase
LITDLEYDGAAFWQAFKSSDCGQRYVFGTNEYADAVATRIALDGFIDDFSSVKYRMGVPVIKLSDAAADCIVLSCVTANHAISALQKLRAAKIPRFADYYTVSAATNELPLVRQVAESRIDFGQNQSQYQWIRARLFDDESREVFDRVMALRVESDLSSMATFKYAPDRQYFEPFFVTTAEEHFVDAGGFDGATTLEFARRCPGYKRIDFFEPAQANLETARAKLLRLPNVVFHEAGLYDDELELSFDPDAGSSSQLSKQGTVRVRCVPLDHVVPSGVTFIKMDIEGAELAALRGSERHIRRQSPKIAVAAYHRPGDFWRIPRFLLSLQPDYRVLLRHYTEGWAETVMYFIHPKDFIADGLGANRV